MEELFVLFDVSIIIILILITYGLVVLLFKRLSNRAKTNEAIDDVSVDILKLIKSNNNYPPLLDVFSSLQSNLVKNGMELNTNLHGYLRYDESNRE